MSKTNIARRSFALMVLPVVLAACGGGSSTEPGVTPSLRLSGTAASRAELAEAGVEARCAAGRGASTTRTSGAYDIDIERGVLPCVLRVTKGSGGSAVVLHSVAVGPAGGTSTAATATANITPATELVVASLAGTAPAAYFSQFDATPTTAAALATTANVQTATNAVGETLKAGGADFTAAGNLLTSALVPTSGGTTGNAYGQALVALDARIVAGGTSVAALVDAVAAASTVTPPPTTSNNITLPAASQLQPVAANCSALRSGNFRFLGLPSLGEGGAVVAVDAASLSIALPGGALQLTANGNCRYRTANNGEMVVSPAGVLVGQAEAAPYRLVMAFPEQNHAVADVAGTWNSVGLDRNLGVRSPYLLSLTFDNAGKVTGAADSGPDLAAMTVFTGQLPNINVSINSAGGFNLTNTTDNWTNRLFAYRSGSGDLMIVQMAGNSGTLGMVHTRKRVREVPVVGTTFESWNLVMTLQETSPAAMGQSRNTWASVNTSDNTATRTSVINFSTGATRPEVFLRNNPQDGYSRRQAATVTASDGSTSTVSTFVSLFVRGMGLSGVVFPNGNLSISVDK
jgi:hypothetical protein